MLPQGSAVHQQELRLLQRLLRMLEFFHVQPNEMLVYLENDWPSHITADEVTLLFSFQDYFFKFIGPFRKAPSMIQGFWICQEDLRLQKQ